MRERGFTLIELLVVIAIIGILAGLVLSSLSTARTNARTAAIKSGVNEFRKLMEFEYIATGSYTNLNKLWVGTGTSCAARGYAGAYAAKAVEICENLINNIGSSVTLAFHTGVDTASGFSNASQYAIMARLPSGTFYCVGSSGKTSDTENGSGGVWASPGCWGNP